MYAEPFHKSFCKFMIYFPGIKEGEISNSTYLIYLCTYNSNTYSHEVYNCGSDLWLVDSIINDMKTLKKLHNNLRLTSYVCVYV
jgi:hypothetical protein